MLATTQQRLASLWRIICATQYVQYAHAMRLFACNVTAHAQNTVIYELTDSMRRSCIQVRPLIKAELRQKKLRPLGSLPPIKPRNMHQATLVEIEHEERQEKWLAKTTRMGHEDFVTATGKRPFVYPGSVHTGGVGYNPPPQSLDRPVDKTQWVSDQTFKSAVPTGKMLGTLDPAADKYEQRLATSLVPART